MIILESMRVSQEYVINAPLVNVFKKLLFVITLFQAIDKSNVFGNI